MLRDGAQNQFISRRVSMPTEKSHAELVRDVDAGVKARSFFSARVADARRLENMRKISDAYSRGEMSLGEARNILKESLQAEGFNPHEGGLRNLAGTARLNLILRQNASMAHAAGEWARMHDPDAMAVFPYVRYHARSDRRTRSEHAHLDGKIFRKDDPFLRTHTPPWEFNCRCWLEEITAKAAGKTPELIQKPTPENKVRVDSRSGFVFDPARAFEEFDLSSVKSAEDKQNVHNDMVRYCAKHGNLITLKATPVPKMLQESYREPDNIAEIRAIFQRIEQRKEKNLDDFSVSVGKLLPEHIERLGLTDFKDDIIFKHQAGNYKVGPNHWERNHSDTLNADTAIRLFQTTIWNPYAELKEDIYGNKRRICFFVKDVNSGELTNVWVVKDNDGKLILEVVDSWFPNRKYIDHLGSQHRKKN